VQGVHRARSVHGRNDKRIIGRSTYSNEQNESAEREVKKGECNYARSAPKNEHFKNLNVKSVK
jgi:hypothetical protein